MVDVEPFHVTWAAFAQSETPNFLSLCEISLDGWRTTLQAPSQHVPLRQSAQQRPHDPAAPS